MIKLLKEFKYVFAWSYKENYQKWSMIAKERLAKDELSSLCVHYPSKQEVLTQLKSLDPVLGPAIAPR